MSFRVKTILGIALIEAVLLALLVVLGVSSVQKLGRDELVSRAATTTKLAEAMVADAIVATDLGALQTLAAAVAETPGVSYFRIIANGQVLAQAGSARELARPFRPDSVPEILAADDSKGGIYDVARDVTVGGVHYGQLQLGLDTGSAARLVSTTRQRALFIAGLEMLLVAGFSWVLGTYLTRQLRALRSGALRLSEGDFTTLLPLRGSDELADTAAAFNTMIQRLQAGDRQLRQSLAAQTEAVRQLAEQGDELTRRRKVMEAVSEVQRAYIEGCPQDITSKRAMRAALQLSGAGCAFLAELQTDDDQATLPTVARLTVEAHLPCPGDSWSVVLDGFSSALLSALGSSDQLQLDSQHIDDPALAAAAAGLPFRAVLALPIRLGNHNVGLLCLARGDRLFSEDEVADLQPLLANLGQLLGAYRSEGRRREAAASAEDLLAELDAIFSLSPDGFAFFNRNGRLSMCNPALASLLGQSQQALTGLSSGEFEALLQSLGADPALLGDADSARLHLERPRPQTLQLALRAVHGSDGTPRGHVLYLRDITRESEIDRMKSEFLSTAAHELRTPMASIHGFSELLLSRRYDEATQRDLLETIHRQSKSLVLLVNDLLDLARIEARVGHDLNISSVMLPPLVADTLAALVLPDAAHRFSVQVADTLPRVDLDAAKFRQAFTNVLSNAIKYSPEGGPIHVVADLRERAGRHFVALEISDTGIGMTPAQQSRVFERFYRADASGAIPGTGLGMSLVREIMQLHDGEVTLQSTLGTGTTVTLWLPVSSALTSRFAAL